MRNMVEARLSGSCNNAWDGGGECVTLSNKIMLSSGQEGATRTRRRAWACHAPSRSCGQSVIDPCRWVNLYHGLQYNRVRPLVPGLNQPTKGSPPGAKG